jgi:DNA-binding NarL/FixJ family response regulator
LNQPSSDPSDVPVFIVAGTRREMLCTALEAQGRRVVSAAPGADAADIFVSSGALIAIADLAGEDAALDALIGAVTLSRGALVVIADSGDPQLDRMIDGGATHFLPRPHSDADLIRALRLADRYIERLRGRLERRTPREHKFTVETETGARERIAARLASDPAPDASSPCLPNRAASVRS